MLHPWKFWKFVLHPWEIPHFFLITPGYCTCTYYVFYTLGNSLPSQPLYFFFGIAHYICLNCYFSRFCRKFYKVFFLIIPSDVSKGSLGIPLPTPKETDMRRGSKLNVGNYLVDEISRIFFYIACKVQNLLS